MIIRIFISLFLFCASVTFAYGAVRYCNSFANQKQAQAYFEAGHDDSARLDGDKDGVACENLPNNTYKSANDGGQFNNRVKGELGIFTNPNHSIKRSSGRIYCRDFNNQPEAQAYFLAGKKGASSLDRDKDGIACECLPGGKNDRACINWQKKNGKR